MPTSDTPSRATSCDQRGGRYARAHGRPAQEQSRTRQREEGQRVMFCWSRGGAMAVLSKILLVEDDPHDVELTLSALTENHLTNEIVVARDGAEALDYLYRRALDTHPEARDPALRAPHHAISDEAV